MKPSHLNAAGAAILITACAVLAFHFHSGGPDDSPAGTPAPRSGTAASQKPGKAIPAAAPDGASAFPTKSSRPPREVEPVQANADAARVAGTRGSNTDSQSPAPTGQAIRLADNFRLPAILIPPRDEQGEPVDLPAPVAGAARGISDRFYQELAAHTAGRAQAAPGNTGNPPGSPSRTPSVPSPGNSNSPSPAITPDIPDRTAAGRPLGGTPASTPGIPAGRPSVVPYENTPGEVITPDPVIDPDGTLVIQPGAVPDDITNRADEQFRSLFGNDAFNRHSMQGAIEVNLPVGDRAAD